MAALSPVVLVLNRGSSSLKRARFTFEPEPQPIGRDLVAAGSGTLPELCGWITSMSKGQGIAAVGYRIVHGGNRLDRPTVITDAVRKELGGLIDLAPNHLPDELALIDAVRESLPDVPHVAAFDTSFHRTMPPVAHRLAIPARFDASGVRSYGFHGLSYTFLVSELERIAGPTAARGRIVLAHLGSGSSLAAVHDRHAVDTTMTFTPTGGLIMSTRSGDLDPGVIAYLAQHPPTPIGDIERLLSHESGLLGVSGTTGDMRLLLERQSSDERARLAVDIYCYRIRKTIGAYAAALGGLDTLVFSGGVGEHAATVRAGCCEALDFLGVEIDAAMNASNATVISADRSRVVVRVIPTNEELIIARSAYALVASRHA